MPRILAQNERVSWLPRNSDVENALWRAAAGEDMTRLFLLFDSASHAMFFVVPSPVGLLGDESHHAKKDTWSCQGCHLPVIEEAVPISSVLGQPRSGTSRHTFAGGNFFMQRMLNRYRNELGVAGEPQAFGEARMRTVAHLQSEAARMSIRELELRGGRLETEISVENLGGHKLPTAYPSRRVWLHVTARDRDGRRIFESGGLALGAAIEGNDNCADGNCFEPHHQEITRPLLPPGARFICYKKTQPQISQSDPAVKSVAASGATHFPFFKSPFRCESYQSRMRLW